MIQSRFLIAGFFAATMIFFGSAVAQQPGEREAFLYVVAINSGDNINPDMLTVVGADPTQTKEYGRIIDIKHLDQVGDNVHHFGYSLDQRRLLIPGLFSDRFYVFDISQDPKDPKLIEVKNDLRQNSDYMAPHTVSALPDGVALVSMLGAATETTGPGGLVLINDETGAFVRHFGPGPDRNPDELGPQYMYDIVYKGNLNRLITTTWGFPADVLERPYSPSGSTIAVWDIEKEKVIQLIDLGDESGAIEADWFHAPSSSYGYVVGTSGNVWLWEDEDKNGFLDFHQVLSGLGAPCDMTLSRDDRYLYISSWLTNTVQQYNISAPYSPEMVGEAKVPHPCMMRLSPDGQRLYVTNSIMRTLDDDAEYGSRNDQYGIYLLKVDTAEGGLSHATGDDTAWVDYSSIQKKHNSGPAGPHMILFDPGVPIEVSHH